MAWIKLPFLQRGPDGYYEKRGEVLHVWLNATNHRHEWHSHRLRSTGRIDTPVGKVHRDYYYAALDVLRWISSINHDALVIAGHSYGGAVAEIVAALRDAQYGKVLLRTYGAVKAGRVEWRSRPLRYHYRHKGDVAPWWPLWPWYRREKPIKVGKLMLPWKAHALAAYEAALDIDKN